MRRGRPPNNTHGMVGISLYLPMETLEKIQQCDGTTQSEKIRNLINKGLNHKPAVRGKGVTSRTLPTPKR